MVGSGDAPPLAAAAPLAPRPKQDRTVLVTVGTTRFDALVRTVDQVAVADALVARGYSRLVIQVGASAYRPHRLLPPNSRSSRMPNGLHVEWFEYAPSLAPLLEASQLVISHAGAGSVFEALAAGAAVVAVPNAALMDDHQSELAEKLAAEGHLAVATPDTLLDVLRNVDAGRLVRYVPGDGAGIVARVDAVCGVAPSGKEK